ncbi:MAG: methyltransferase domain-containing protein [Marivibrio sp.]|uniref:methyltransferase domain-containing protein n=1 Tax=Marivibrio sp. TaxID=2039719 RepID=UPI0032ECA2DF
MKVDKNIEAANSAWTFDAIGDDFESHIEKSIPHYIEWQELICQLSDFFLNPDCLVYDIGAATGALSRKLAKWNEHRTGMRIVGIDSVESMVKKAQELNTDPRVTFIHEDLRVFDFEPCSMVMSYYTVQFIHPHYRQQLIDRIYESLHWGGALILFEKVRGADARFQDIQSQLYVDFKQKNGFSTDEIIGKSRSLKGVLEPFSTEGNLGLLQRAGFSDIMPVARWMCFEGLLAIK